MSDEPVGSGIGRPSSCEGRVARNPFAADIAVDLNRVRLPVVRIDANGHVGERQRLSDQVIGLIDIRH